MNPSVLDPQDRPHLLLWLGPGADDRGAWSWAAARRRVLVAAPERVEASVANEGTAVASKPWEAGIRGYCVRDGRLVGPGPRRRLRSLLGAHGMVVQVVREPVAALRAEVRRAQVEALTARWISPGNARASSATATLPTPESCYDRLLPRLHFDRRGRAFTPSRGRRLVIARDEFDDPRSQRLRRMIEEWLGPEATHLPWEGSAPRRDHDLTEALLGLSTGPVAFEGARLCTRLVLAEDLRLRPDLVELARVPSIANRVHFCVEDASLALVADRSEWERLPRGVRQALTGTGVCQHRLEEEWLPRWIERTAHVHHSLGDDLPAVSHQLASRLRSDLREDLDRLFAIRPTLEGRWGMLSTHAFAQ